MATNLMRVFVLMAAGVLAGAPRASAQTIPELLEQANESLGETIRIETGGPPPSVESVLTMTDVIVRGTIGTPTSHLSEDKTKVYSDYPIVDPVVLFPPAQSRAARPGPAPPPTTVTITHIGGTVSVLGHEFTMEHSALPPFPQGTEGIFLLKKVGDRYTIAGTFYGAFRIEGDRVSSLARFEGYGTELKELRLDATIQWLVARKQDVKRR